MAGLLDGLFGGGGLFGGAKPNPLGGLIDPRIEQYMRQERRRQAWRGVSQSLMRAGAGGADIGPGLLMGLGGASGGRGGGGRGGGLFDMLRLQEALAGQKARGKETERQRRQEFSRDALGAGNRYDPDAARGQGILWNQPPQPGQEPRGLEQSERRALLEQAYPEQVGKARVAEEFPAAVKPPTGMRPAAGGGVEAIPEYVAMRQKLAEAGRSQTDINLPPQEKAYDKTVGNFYGETFADYQKAAASARSNNAKMARAKQLIANVRTGAAQPAAQTVKRIARDLGVDLEARGITDDTPFADAMRSLGGQLALDSVQRTKGSVSEREMDLFQKIAPSLGSSPEGNMLIIEMAQTLNNQAVEVARLARGYVQEKGRLDEGFYDRLDRYHQENPLFTEDLGKRIDSVMQRQKITATKEIGGRPYYKIGNMWFEGTPP